MTRLLVSVRSPAEAEIALTAGADLIDAKDPMRGALGGLARREVEAIVTAVAGRRPVSAVVGDHRAAAPAIAAAKALAGTGIAFAKIGFGPGLGEPADIARFAGKDLPPLIAVFFADEAPPTPALLAALAGVGFRGAMLDTRGKTGHRLTDCLARDALAAFVEACRGQGLLSGLAGSLRIGDIDALAPLGPDYLGFRGGLCEAGDRRNGLSAEAVRDAVRRMSAVTSGLAA